MRRARSLRKSYRRSDPGPDARRGGWALNSYGIQPAFEVYDGDHTNHIVDRMEKVVLPFFSKNLSFPAAR